MNEPRTRTPHGTRDRLLAVIAAILLLFALRATRSVTMPLALGFTFAMLAWPIQQRVSRRAPGWTGLLAAVLAIVLAVGGILALLVWSSNLLVSRVQDERAKIGELRARVAAVAARVGIGSASPPAGGADAGRSAGDGPRGAGGAPLPTPAGGAMGGGDESAPLAGVGKRVVGGIVGSLTSLALAIGFAALSLAELGAVRARIRGRFDPATADPLLAIGAEVARAVRRYFAVKSLTSVIAGACTGLLALAVGLDLAAVWALVAFLLEYVPSVGSIIAVVPPALWAFVQFDGIAKPAAITGALVVMQLVLGNYVDPKLEGRHMSLSPLVVLFSIVFWAWVWGPFGALLGVPITVTLTILARHFPGSWWAWALLTERQHKD